MTSSAPPEPIARRAQSGPLPRWRRYGLPAATLVGLATASVLFTLAGTAAGPTAADAPTGPAGDACGGIQALTTVAGVVCVHGDDPQFRVAAGAHGSDAGLARLTSPCHGDGASGNRIALYYAYLAGHPNRISSAVPPRGVAAPSVTMVSLTSAELRWNQPTSSRVTGYTLMKDSRPVWHGSRTSWTDTHAQTGRGSYQIRAINEAGPRSAPVNAALPAPAAPTAVTATTGSPTTIDWTAHPALAAGYRLYGLPDGGSPRYLGDWPASARQASDNTLALLKHWHRYRVCAYNDASTACRDQASS